MSSDKRPGGRWSGWSRSAVVAWTAVCAYVVVLYSTPGLLNSLYRWAFRELGGRQSTSFWINVFFGAAGLCVLVAVWRRRFRVGGRELLALTGIAAAFATCLWWLEIPAKRLHFLQYAPLTLLVLHAVGRLVESSSRYLVALLLVTLVGVGDEWVQSHTPNRHFGVVDMAINATAAALTLAFCAFVWRQPPRHPSP